MLHLPRALRYLFRLCLLAIWVGYLASADGESWTVHLQEDGVARPDSGLIWRHTLPTLSTFTLCLRFRSFRSRYSDYIFSYAVPRHDNELAFHVKYELQQVRLACCSSRIFHIIPVQVRLLTWFSFCAAVDLASHAATFVHPNGFVDRLRLFDSLQEPDQPLIVTEGGSVILGQDQDQPLGGMDKGQSFNGLMSDLYLSEILLTEQQMKDYLACRMEELLALPHLMDIENVREDFKFGVQTNVTTSVDSCSPSKNKQFSVFSEGRSKEKARHFCSTLNGDIATPMSADENVALSIEGSYLAHKCTEYDKSNSMWIGVYWNYEKQLWKNQKTEVEVTYKNFQVEIKPSIKEQLCVAASLSGSLDTAAEGNWDIEACGRELCTACQFENPLPIKVRGLCLESLFDREYYVYDTVNDRPVFNGYRHSRMMWSVNSTDSQSYHWLLYQMSEPYAKARMFTKSVLMYPIGVHEFEVSGDKCPGKVRRLKFTSCRQETYTCGDGVCIDLSKRCNLELDCSDHSDELNCETLVQPEGYEMRLPPPKVNAHNPASVSIDCDIRVIRMLDLLNSQIVMDVTLKRSWYDSRLRYKNLHADSNLNQITDLMNRVWYPDITTLGSDFSQVEVLSYTMRAWGERTASPLPDDYQLIDEDEFYDGAENPLVMEQDLTLTLMCTFDLSLYPFDTQRCTMNFYIVAFTRHYVVSYLKNVTYSGTRRLLEYRVTGLKYAPMEYQNKSGQHIEITLANLYGYYISSAYVPTLLLLIISYLTFFFSLEDFTNRVMVSLTSLLVLASLFSQIASGLPKTSYLKLIDVWFIFCILSDFVMVTVLIFINSFLGLKPITCVVPLPEGKKGKPKWHMAKKTKWRIILNPRRMNFVAQILLPILMSLFILTYFGFVASFVYKVRDEFET